MLPFKIKVGHSVQNKNAKRKETSIEVRELIIRLHSEGHSYAEIAENLNRSRSTVASIVQRSQVARVANGTRTGRPPSLNARERRAIL